MSGGILLSSGSYLFLKQLIFNVFIVIASHLKCILNYKRACVSFSFKEYLPEQAL